MTKPDQPIPFPKLVNLRRRVLPFATTAAALGLTGCAITPLWPLNAGAPAVTEQPATTVTPQTTANKVDAFTANAGEAIDRTDPQRLKTATGGNSVVEPKSPAPQVILANTQESVTPPPPVRPLVAPPTDKNPTTVPAGLPISPQIHVLDGPSGVTVTNFPTTTETVTVSPSYTVYSPKKEAVTVAPEVVPAAPRTDPLDSALEVIRMQAMAHPSFNRALALALLEQSEGKTRDMNAARNLSAIDQQVLQDLLSSLQSMNTPAASTATLPDRAAPLVEAAKKWQTAAADVDLTLPKLVLASRVDSYGVYSAVEAKFKAGEKHTVIVYCEVANFVARKTADGWFETRLAQQETLATDDGLLLWRPNAEEVEDRSMNQRRDFYLVKKLTIPDNLATGKYALRMSVTDRNTNKIAVVSLPIEIVAK